MRNRVRHKLVPILDAHFPSWRSSVLALAETQELVADFLESEAKKRLPWENPSGEALLRLREEDFLNAPPILREEAIFAAVDALAERDSKGPSQNPKRSAIRRAVREGTAADLGQARLERRNGFITMTPVMRRGQTSEKRHGFSLLIKEAGFYTLKGEVFGAGRNLSLGIRAGCPQKLPNSGFSANLPTVFRNHRAGDFIYKGGQKRRFSDIVNSRERSRYTAIITAWDAQGPAAFIAVGVKGTDSEGFTVISRDDKQDGVSCHSSFEISLKHEGIDV